MKLFKIGRLCFFILSFNFLGDFDVLKIAFMIVVFFHDLRHIFSINFRNFIMILVIVSQLFDFDWIFIDSIVPFEIFKIFSHIKLIFDFDSFGLVVAVDVFVDAGPECTLAEEFNLGEGVGIWVDGRVVLVLIYIHGLNEI